MHNRIPPRLIHLWTVICVDGQPFAATGIQADSEEEAHLELCSKFGIDPETTQTMTDHQSVPELSWQLYVLNQELIDKTITADAALDKIIVFSKIYQQTFSALTDILEHVAQWNETTGTWTNLDLATQACREFFEDEVRSVPESREDELIDFSKLDIANMVQDTLTLRKLLR